MSPEEFDREVRQLEGMRLKQIRYYEHPGSYPAWRGLSVLDDISYGVDLIGEDRSFCVTWDNTFIDHGLGIFEGILLDRLHDTLVTNVTQGSRWSSLVGQRILEARVHWYLVTEVQPDDLEKYPQSIELLFEQGDVVLLSAAMPQPGTQSLLEMSENVVVLFGDDTIREHAIGGSRSAR
ncbi:hypothetical protein E7T06_00355 [Deinococcus sp. Arct2-2]|uniref:hypothetical protein n=1 Tax=Deinococcus sp. Arct2-2 TaxID=2568653 RepID=UPI0010A39B87|nr:hypothetical protein [Deinococcus sp. Arct2-2]THF71865.1 hypothetical protein E7T06_00355 [Deinococcus sp. Arct2-2]